jgi:benzoyl-CoA reductase/2-hydroxyglutaryl-CoA dehydratase subunit BcrC/BadD/HgdB
MTATLPITGELAADDPESAAAADPSTNLLDRLDREQDQVMRELDELNEQIEALIQTHARTRHEDAEETPAPPAEAA